MNVIRLAGLWNLIAQSRHLYQVHRKNNHIVFISLSVTAINHKWAVRFHESNASRCFTVDLWDGPNGEPVIYHGYTMTNDISVRDVLTEAILPYAFKSSAYPLILSFENHLSPRQQGVMAVLLKDILGDALYDEPVSEDMAGLPSPHQLRYKIIIKSKKSSVSESRSSIEGPPSEVENLTELTQLHATVSLQESYGSLSSWHKGFSFEYLYLRGDVTQSKCGLLQSSIMNRLKNPKNPENPMNLRNPK